MFSAPFIFKPRTYDEEFHRLDTEIEAYVATIPGFLGAEKWVSFDGQTKNSMYYFETMDAMFQLSRFDAHREGKGKCQNWYDGYQIVFSEIKKSYGDGAIETIAKAQPYPMQNETRFTNPIARLDPCMQGIPETEFSCNPARTEPL
jgi:heme-degrading monooxygenase HmoA